jgi:cytochrome o ubiquinol oxidase operon protein cyoD
MAAARPATNGRTEAASPKGSPAMSSGSSWQAASFYLAASHALWPPAIPAALINLAVAQTGAHLVFFLHITTGPESTNNVLALAFGVLIVFLLMGGTLVVMTAMNHNMPPLDQIMSMQR